jgi:hypothetical protein
LKGRTLSSLRIESLRLVWLETFIEVANAENISEAARNMSFDQSTVSRYMKALQTWSGKKLIVPGMHSDPEDAGINVGLTEHGREFHDIAVTVVAQLTGFRTEEAQCAELLGRIEGMISTMRTDLNSKNPSEAVLSVQSKIEQQTRWLAALHSSRSVIAIKGSYPFFRRFFANYETVLRRERRKRKRPRTSSAKNIDMSQFSGKQTSAP